MGTLLTFKQILNLKRGLIFDEKLIRSVYKNVIDAIEHTPQFKKDSKPHTSVEGETDIGEVQSEAIDDFLKEIINRQIDLKSFRVYCSFNSYSKNESYSYTIDVYLGRLSSNLVSVQGSEQNWAIESKNKLEYFFSKVPLIPTKKDNIPIRLLNLFFNGKVLFLSWVIVIFSVFFSKFFPNIYYSWASVFITAYALIGIVIKTLLEQKNELPLVKFNLKTVKEDKKIFLRSNI